MSHFRRENELITISKLIYNDPDTLSVDDQ